VQVQLSTVLLWLSRYIHNTVSNILVPLISTSVHMWNARFVILFQPPHSRRWWSHSSTPDWIMATTVCSLVSQLTLYGDYSLFLMW